jgi:hypothetical protein
VGTNTEKKSKVNAESTNICTSFTANPEDAEMSVIVKFIELALVNRSDTKLTLDGGDQRRALEQSTSKSLEGSLELSLTTGDLVVETDHADVLLSGTLLGLDQASSTVNANNQATGNLRIKGATVSSLFRPVLITRHFSTVSNLRCRRKVTSGSSSSKQRLRDWTGSRACPD